MTGDEEMPAVFGFGDGNAGFIRNRHKLQTRYGSDLCRGNCHGPRLRRVKDIVKSAEERRLSFQNAVRINAGKLYVQIFPVQTVKMIQGGVSAPAQMKSTVHMGAAPLHNGADLIPVCHFFETNMVKRRTGDNHTVKFAVPNLVEGGIKGFHMVGIRMHRRIAGCLQEFHIHLQRRV